MITIDRVSKRFDKRAVLDELTLALDAGDRVALIGSNGAGKTTVFRALLGLYRHEGEIRFNGDRGARRNPDNLSRIAFVPQLPPPLRMPVRELLKFAENGAGADRGRMEDISGSLGIDLDEVSRRPFYRLSGGQKQKILVTIALSRDVELMIFDEPAANLDPAARSVFIDLLAQRREVSMLIASHRLEEVAPLVNRVIELDRGKVVLDDNVVDRLKEGVLRRAEIVINAAHAPFATALSEWGFTADATKTAYSGRVPAAETFRFLGLLARYGSLIDRMELDQGEAESN